MDESILSDFGINLLEEEIDDVIFQTNEFLCDATFTGTQGPFWGLSLMRDISVAKAFVVQGFMIFWLTEAKARGTKVGQKRWKIFLFGYCRQSARSRCSLYSQIYNICPAHSKFSTVKFQSSKLKNSLRVNETLMSHFCLIRYD